MTPESALTEARFRAGVWIPFDHWIAWVESLEAVDLTTSDGTALGFVRGRAG